ncbi:MAG: hypothetical protein H7321_01340 [Bacteroidia bacterium]|nr:hypothetical protein [Bacteroidia bacterium]
MDNKIFNMSDTIVSSDTGKVKLHINTLNFFRNTEYFTPIDEGQTFIGFQGQADVSYQPYKNLRIHGGIYIQKDYGTNGFTLVQPIFRITYRPGKWQYNLGQLDGSTNHRLIEPLFNIDRAITNKLENGLQAKYSGKKLWLDGWLNWEKATYHEANVQEQFTIGASVRLDILKRKKIEIVMPFQNILNHRGGQIDITGNPIVSRMNTAIGISAICNIFKTRIRNFKLEQYYVASNDFSPALTQPYKNGHGFLSTLSVSTKNTTLMLNYWNGTEYQSGRGTLIYNSYAFYDVYYHERFRELIFVRFLYYKNIYKNLNFDFRAEPIYDLINHEIQYSYSVYLSYKVSFGLGKIKALTL